MKLFEGEQLAEKRGAALKQAPPVRSNWRPPSEFPDLTGADVVGFDVETKEFDWSHGPGWSRGQSHLIGVALSAIKGNLKGKWYFPLRHEFPGTFNFPVEPTLRYIKAQLETNVPKVAANAIFDVGNLAAENVYVGGYINDVQFAEAILEEDSPVNLDHLGSKYLNKGKTTNEVYEWLDKAYGKPKGQDQRANLWRAPSELVGPYAEDDALLPLELLPLQRQRLADENLNLVYEIECSLIRVIVKMGFAGVTINIAEAEKAMHTLLDDFNGVRDKIKHITGMNVNPNSSDTCGAALADQGIQVPRTRAGKYSVTKEWLKGVNNPVAELITEGREIYKMRSTFVKSYLIDRRDRNNKVHCSFHPLRGDQYGTQTGRFSSSDPNLQNIPVRTELGKKIRNLFTYDNGHLCWEKNDYSQIEYRMLAHYAVGRSGDALRAAYNADPKTDYHDKTFYQLCDFMNWDKNDDELKAKFRRPIKNINFGFIYGMGMAKLKRALIEYFQGALTEAQIVEIFEGYHAANPYVKSTAYTATQLAQETGFITTITGRRRRFNLWEPNEFGHYERALPKAAALAEYGPNIRPAATHKALNSRLQGSAADVIKIAIVAADRAGIYDVIGAPRLQVHDELDHSVIDDSPIQREAYREYHHILENAVQCRVPIRIDSHRGETWGTAD